MKITLPKSCQHIQLQAEYIFCKVIWRIDEVVSDALVRLGLLGV